jgi:hypothetical protein
LPVNNARRMHENVRLFDEAIRTSGARTVLYMTEARNAAAARSAASKPGPAAGRRHGLTLAFSSAKWASTSRRKAWVSPSKAPPGSFAVSRSR